MKSAQILKAAGGIACVVFALNVNAQTNSDSSASSTTMSQKADKAGEKIDDGALTTKVKAQLLETGDVKSTHIHVKSRNGVVSLTGTVPTAADKTAAGEATEKVSGVTSVRNHLKIVE
jgi:hyperosmotically inducible periplasmic protein